MYGCKVSTVSPTPLLLVCAVLYVRPCALRARGSLYVGLTSLNNMLFYAERGAGNADASHPSVLSCGHDSVMKGLIS